MPTGEAKYKDPHLDRQGKMRIVYLHLSEKVLTPTVSYQAPNNLRSYTVRANNHVVFEPIDVFVFSKAPDCRA
jgi:hypothetical protein